MKKLILVTGLVVFCFYFTGCFGLAPAVSRPPASSDIESTQSKEGKVSSVHLVDKDFVSLGIIFVSSTATKNFSGAIIEGSEITFEMLMKEAVKLGADDIVNLRIDEFITGTGGGYIGSQRKTYIEYKATALAIKYKQ
jgi:uncharacterized protein YbjQ (UPF0145 family)